MKYQSVNQELQKAIEKIPVPIDDISISSHSNTSYVSATPSQKKLSNSRSKILEWSKSNVRPPSSGNIFPQVLAPSMDVSQEGVYINRQPLHTFGSIYSKKDLVKSMAKQDPRQWEVEQLKKELKEQMELNESNQDSLKIALDRIQKLEVELQQKETKIQLQEAELKLMKEQKENTMSTRDTYNSNLNFNDPELMSEEETLQALSMLLNRISKSKHMIKQIHQSKDFQKVFVIKQPRVSTERDRDHRLTTLIMPQSSISSMNSTATGFRSIDNILSKRKNKTMVSLVQKIQ